ncbi:MAG TPA: patatin-like phospholipase family protein [Xanthobacteraceae bacterium]|nr:patatin-like phospholipase family protein [Xanthobacteraceae bacterium]
MDQRTDTTEAKAVEVDTKTVNLALQGGGSHGAFTWGVLDRLLEDDRISFEGISASSAGAVNAVLLAHGLTVGGPDAAREALRHFWKRLSEKTSHGILQPSPIDRITGNFGLEHSPGYLFVNVMSYFTSPYLFNPLNLNPLRTVLEEVVDFERLRREPAVKLFLCATNVRTGKVKIFKTDELSPNHVLASSCLPLLMHTVEIDGEAYWDGGFSGNPAIFPLVYECNSRDVVMVHLTPAERPEVPFTSHDIMNRMQEIGFNAALIREMRAVAFINKRLGEGKMAEGKEMLIHVIEAEDVIREFPGSSRLNNSWDFLSHLYEVGRKRADTWLTDNFARLGEASTVDLEEKYF